MIFRHYRDLLKKKYEAALADLCLGECVLAYRSIPTGKGGAKCNIDFAVEAFAAIRSAKDAIVLCLDIKSFFDNIDHELIENTWKRLISCDWLPDDHFAVMRAATKYSFIHEKVALGLLGHFGAKPGKNGTQIRGYLKPRRSLGMRLCTPSEFQTKIVKNLNVSTVGIPQGLPISDVLANAALLDFDLAMKQLASQHDGVYRRYSDDILLIVKGNSHDAKSLVAQVEAHLNACCSSLHLGHDKSAVFGVKLLANGRQEIAPLPGFKCVCRVDYLGLSYDGKLISIRESTLAKLKARIARRVRKHVNARQAEVGALTSVGLMSKLRLQGIMREYGRREESALKSPTGKKQIRNFHCYAVRAAQRAGINTSKILKQISGLNAFIIQRAEREVKKLVP